MANERTFRLKDSTFIRNRGLSGTSATYVAATSFDLGSVTDGAFLAPCELEIAAPALTATQLYSTSSISYSLQESTDNSTFTTLADDVIVQAGAATASSVAAQTVRFRLPSDVSRYVRLREYQTGSGGDPSSSAVSVKLCF